MSKPS
ncbi:hypothetical protein VCHC56A1_0347, partial [Vibrio cholerae HC-56A1]